MGKEDAWMQEEVNWKKLCILFLHNIWKIIATGVAGAVIGSSLYLLIAVVLAGPAMYQVEGGFYIDFADGVLDAHDYYNAYTWNSVMHQDKIIECVMEQPALARLGVMDRTYVEESIEADILSDVRYLTVTVTCDNGEKAEAIFDGCVVALQQFAEEMDEFQEITVTHNNGAKQIMIPVFTWRAGMVGGMIGIVLAILVFLFLYAMDDSVYVPDDFTKRYGKPVFGIIIKGDAVLEPYHKELLANLSYQMKETEEITVLFLGTERESYKVLEEIENLKINCISAKHCTESFAQMRQSGGVILAIPYGMKNGKQIDKYIDLLMQQDCTLSGALLVDADECFMKKYYGVKKRRQSGV